MPVRLFTEPAKRQPPPKAQPAPQLRKLTSSQRISIAAAPAVPQAADEDHAADAAMQAAMEEALQIAAAQAADAGVRRTPSDAPLDSPRRLQPLRRVGSSVSTARSPVVRRALVSAELLDAVRPEEPPEEHLDDMPVTPAAGGAGRAELADPVESALGYVPPPTPDRVKRVGTGQLEVTHADLAALDSEVAHTPTRRPRPLPTNNSSSTVDSLFGSASNTHGVDNPWQLGK